MTTNSIVILFGLLATLLALIAMLFVIYIQLLERRRLSEYREMDHRAVLSEIRESYEKRLSELNYQLAATQDRWQEANHLVISGQNRQPKKPSSKIQNSTFLRSFGIDSGKILVNPNLVFMLTPFNADEMSSFYAVKEVCDQSGLTCLRGDETNAEGNVLGHIVQLIAESGIIIANIGSRNPNVFYELGIAHSLSKPTILISRSINDVPFDLKYLRIVIYEHEVDLKDKLKTALIQINSGSRQNG